MVPTPFPEEAVAAVLRLLTPEIAMVCEPSRTAPLLHSVLISCSHPRSNAKYRFRLHSAAARLISTVHEPFSPAKLLLPLYSNTFILYNGTKNYIRYHIATRVPEV